MLPCHNCAYKREIPGNAHIKCIFAWNKANEEIKNKIPVNNNSERTHQWFIFPFNYDPIWGPNECPAFSDTFNPEMMQQFDPLMELLSLLR